MKLAAQAFHPPRQARQLRVQRRVGEVDVRSGKPTLAQILRQGLQHQQTVSRIGRQQPWAADRAERHSAKQFWVVGDTGPLTSIGPTMIEHILAKRVPLAVRGQQRPYLSVTLQHQVLGGPARVARHAAAVLHCTEKSMAQEGLAGWHKGIPGGRRKITQVGKAVQAGHVFGSLSEDRQYPQGRPVAQMTNAGWVLQYSIT